MGRRYDVKLRNTSEAKSLANGLIWMEPRVLWPAAEGKMARTALCCGKTHGGIGGSSAHKGGRRKAEAVREARDP